MLAVTARRVVICEWDRFREPYSSSRYRYISMLLERKRLRFLSGWIRVAPGHFLLEATQSKALQSKAGKSIEQHSIALQSRVMKCGGVCPHSPIDNGVIRWKSKPISLKSTGTAEADSRQATPAAADPRELAQS